MTLTTVISGGQTGVDQAALRAAMQYGLSCAGWCPPGRESESGTIPLEFPLRETRRNEARKHLMSRAPYERSGTSEIQTPR